MNNLIILDRDGVINFDSPEYIKSPDEWLPIPGSLEAISILNQLGYKVVIATNQSGIGRGFYTMDILNTIHNKMRNDLSKYNGKIDKIFICPHHPNDNCDCRKPKPGLLYQIAKEYKVNLENLYVVGDSLRDIQAAKSISANPILLLSGYKKEQSVEFDCVPVYENLLHFVTSLK